MRSPRQQPVFPSRLWNALSVLVATALFTPPSATAGSFQGLGFLPGGGYSDSKPTDISSDGTVVVGQSQSSQGTQAFRWTKATGMVGLGDLGGKDPYSTALSVSANGLVVVGGSRSPNSGDLIEAFCWKLGDGMTAMGALPGGAVFSSGASGVSTDGSVIVGSSTSALSPSGGEAFRWTEATGMMGMGVLPGSPTPTTVPWQLSADGAVFVGFARTTQPREAFRWSKEEGLVPMGDFPGISFDSWATGVSADGSVIVGFASGGGLTSFRWTKETGMVDLGNAPGGIYSLAWGTSADGAVVVGVGDVNSIDVPTYWDETNGMRSLVDILIGLNLGPAIQGWHLQDAIAVSADGMTVTGWGFNPDGNGEAWIANLGPPSVVEIPAASGVGLSAFAALVAIAALGALRIR